MFKKIKLLVPLKRWFIFTTLHVACSVFLFLQSNFFKIINAVDAVLYYDSIESYFLILWFGSYDDDCDYDEDGVQQTKVKIST